MARTASNTPAKRGGFFRGLAKASSTSSRAPFISRPGTTLYRVKRLSAGVNRTDDAYFHLDVTGIHKIADGALPEPIRKMNAAAVAAGAHDRVVDATGHGKGESLSWRVRVHGEWKELQLGNIKNCAEAILEALGVDDHADYEDEEWDDAIFGDEGIAGEDQPAAGILLVGTTDARISKKGDVFTTTTWTPGDDLARDLIAKGVLTAADCGFGDDE